MCRRASEEVKLRLRPQPPHFRTVWYLSELSLARETNMRQFELCEVILSDSDSSGHLVSFEVMNEEASGGGRDEAGVRAGLLVLQWQELHQWHSGTPRTKARRVHGATRNDWVRGMRCAARNGTRVAAALRWLRRHWSTLAPDDGGGAGGTETWPPTRTPAAAAAIPGARTQTLATH